MSYFPYEYITFLHTTPHLLIQLTSITLPLCAGHHILFLLFTIIIFYEKVIPGPFERFGSLKKKKKEEKNKAIKSLPETQLKILTSSPELAIADTVQLVTFLRKLHKQKHKSLCGAFKWPSYHDSSINNQVFNIHMKKNK